MTVRGGSDASPPEDAAPGSDVERLVRWVSAGGEWRVVARTATRRTVSLLTCDGGEEMERIVSSDFAFLTYVDARQRDET